MWKESEFSFMKLSDQRARIFHTEHAIVAWVHVFHLLLFALFSLISHNLHACLLDFSSFTGINTRVVRRASCRCETYIEPNVNPQGASHK